MKKMDKESLILKIKDVIRLRLKDSEKNRIVLDMKSGNKVTIIRKHISTHYSHGCRVEGKCWYEVRQTSVDEKLYFKTITAIAKSIAYGYIK